jgi:hypothetical protein
MGPIVLHFERTGLNTGLVAEGTTTNPPVVAAILVNPANYYSTSTPWPAEAGLCGGSSGNQTARSEQGGAGWPRNFKPDG